MPFTDDQKNRAVAEEFLGWKPINEMCGICRLWPDHESAVSPHIPPTPLVPPPDLLQPANAWALLVALLNKRHSVDFDDEGMVGITIYQNEAEACVSDLARPINWAAALRDAAFALTEEGRDAKAQ